MPAQRVAHLGRAQRGDAALELLVPGESAAGEEVVGEPRRDGAVLGARQAPGFEQSLFRRLELRRGETLLARAGDFFAQGALDARLVLRREEPAAPAAPPRQEVLLEEIRDLLKQR